MVTSSSQTPKHRAATYEDFLAIPPAERFHEIIEGELVRKAMPGAKHGLAQARLVRALADYEEDGTKGRLGGWLLMTEVEILLPQRQPYRPDIVGWRSENMQALPDDFPVPIRPDWVCEIVSPGDARRDTIVKYREYAKAGIPHYWLVDLAGQSLTALTLQGEHYSIQAEGQANENLRAAPFELVEIAVGSLFRLQRSAS